MISLFVIMPIIVEACIPTMSPDDMLTVPLMTTLPVTTTVTVPTTTTTSTDTTTTTSTTTTTTTTTTSSTSTTTTTPDNSMCQLCPNPYDCAMIPTGAMSCDPAPSADNPMPVREATGCRLTFDCGYLGTVWTQDMAGVWTERAETMYDDVCTDANPMWLYMGMQVQRIVCAAP